jgi:hypothetical protein
MIAGSARWPTGANDSDRWVEQPARRAPPGTGIVPGIWFFGERFEIGGWKFGYRAVGFGAAALGVGFFPSYVLTGRPGGGGITHGEPIVVMSRPAGKP